MSKRKRVTDSISVGAVVDHEAFPGIVDTILAYASWTELCVIRQTSKAFLAKVDAILARHLILTAYDGMTVKIKSPYEPVPSLYDRPLIDWTRPGGKKNTIAVKNARQTLAHTRVVDLIGPEGRALRTITKMLTNVKTLRIVQDGEFDLAHRSTIRAEKVVLFAHVGQLEGDPQETLIKPTVKKLVINILYHDLGLSHDSILPVVVNPTVPSYSRLEELVVIFTDWGPHEDGTDCHCDCDCDCDCDSSDIEIGALRLHHLSIDLAIAIFTDRAQGKRLKTTIVDFTTVDPVWLGLPMGLSETGSVYCCGHEECQAEYLKESLLGSLLDALDFVTDNFDCSAEAPENIIERIEFISGRDYQARIGSEEYMIETVEDFA